MVNNTTKEPVFDWEPFYRAVAEKLLDYRERRQELITVVRSVFAKTGISMPTLDVDNKLEDIDPFTIFGLFNKSITEANRKKIVAEFKELLLVDCEVPTKFDGIPIVQNLNATFYRFKGDREDNAIEDLWELFVAALDFSNDMTKANVMKFADSFGKVVSVKGNAIGKVTMALYWIAPETFLNLDSRNLWYFFQAARSHGIL